MRACAIFEDSSTPMLCYAPFVLWLLTAKPTSVFSVIMASHVAGPSEAMEHHDGKEQIMWMFL